MSDEDALLAAIRAHPDEDTPRLAYADWLDEADRPERAEFIRLQIEAAQPGTSERRRQTIAARCKALRNAHITTWLAPILPKKPPWTCPGEFHRGFLSHVIGTARDVVGPFARIAAFCPVQQVEVDFAPYPCTPEDSVAMAASPDLARVRRLECRRFPEHFGAALLASPHLTGLQSLYLQWGWLEEGVELASRSPVVANLRHLWVWGSSSGEITPGRGLGAIVTAEWPALKQVRLENLNVGQEGLLAVVRAFAERGRQFVHVHDNRLTVSAAFEAIQVALGGKLPSLSVARECSLQEPVNPVPDGARVLAFRGFHSHGDAIVRRVRTKVPPGRFDRIGIVHCGTSADGARELARWPGLVGVKELDLRLNLVGDTGALDLAKSPHLEGVELLLLAHNNITKKGKDALKARFGRRVRIAEK